MSREVLQQALEALEHGEDSYFASYEEAITAIKAALAQPVPEEIAWTDVTGEVPVHYSLSLNSATGILQRLFDAYPNGLLEILSESAEIIHAIDPEHAPSNIRWPIVDELEGFVHLLLGSVIHTEEMTYRPGGLPQPEEQQSCDKQEPLTDEEIADLADDYRSQYIHGGQTYDEFDYKGFARAIEAKLKEKA